MDTLYKKLSEQSKLVAGFDNMSLLVFIMIAGYILYVIYRFLIEISKHRNEINSQIRNIDNLAESHQLEDDCPICHEKIRNAVELDCNHKFCAKCIMDYYIITQPRLSCPMCRKDIRLINTLNFDKSQDMRRYMEMIVTFNHDHLNGYNYYLNYLLNFPFLFSHGVASIVNNSSTLVLYSIIGFLVILYFLSPIDFIPDYLGIIGYIDDIFVIIGFVYGIIRSFYFNFMESNEIEFNRIRAE